MLPALLGLAGHGGPVAAMALSRAVQFDDPDVLEVARKLMAVRDVTLRLAALRAIGDFGDAADLPFCANSQPKPSAQPQPAADSVLYRPSISPAPPRTPSGRSKAAVEAAISIHSDSVSIRLDRKRTFWAKRHSLNGFISRPPSLAKTITCGGSRLAPRSIAISGCQLASHTSIDGGRQRRSRVLP